MSCDDDLSSLVSYVLMSRESGDPGDKQDTTEQLLTTQASRKSWDVLGDHIRLVNPIYDNDHEDTIVLPRPVQRSCCVIFGVAVVSLVVVAMPSSGSGTVGGGGCPILVLANYQCILDSTPLPSDRSHYPHYILGNDVFTTTTTTIRGEEGTGHGVGQQ
jgi:hypothetical protein